MYIALIAGRFRYWDMALGASSLTTAETDITVTFGGVLTGRELVRIEIIWSLLATYLVHHH